MPDSHPLLTDVPTYGVDPSVTYRGLSWPEAKHIRLFHSHVGIRRQFGITEAELYEFARSGAVSDETREWADNLRAGRFA